MSVSTPGPIYTLPKWVGEARGLRTEGGLLVVIDGAKALAAGVRKVFGDKALVQRELSSFLLPKSLHVTLHHPPFIHQ